VPVNWEKNVLFIHIPKTAGISVRRWLCMECLMDGYWHYTAQRLLTDGLLTQEQMDGLFKFAVVRNPWDRLISAYFCNFSHAGENWKKFTTYHEYVKDTQRRIGRFSVAEGLGQQEQHPFIYSYDGKLLVDEVYKFEERDEWITELKKRFGLGEMFPAENVSHQRDSNDHHDMYPNDELVEIVGKIYKKDIELFNYTY